MPAAIKKLLLIPKKYVRSDLLQKAELSKSVLGEALPVCPLDRTAWPLEAGISHYAWVLEFPKLKDYEAAKAWADDPKTVPSALVDFDESPEKSLAARGLQIHPMPE